MSKVYFTHGIAHIDGTLDQNTMWGNRSGYGGICRRYVVPKASAQNAIIGTIGSNLASVWDSTSVEYREDMKSYIERYVSEKPTGQINNRNFSQYSQWIKAMWAWYDTDPTHIDLTTITVADIVTKDADIRTVKRAVEAGYLPMITVYDDLTSDIE